MAAPGGSEPTENTPLTTGKTSLFKPKQYDALVEAYAAKDKPPPNCPFFGWGHVGNDLMAAVWFGFLLHFLVDVAKLPRSGAATVFLVGQLTDAVASPAAGYISDATPLHSKHWVGTNKRLVWIALGSFVGAICFFLLFAGPVLLPSGPSATYYAALGALFNIAWAFVNVNHLAMVPEITWDVAGQVQLNATRYIFNVLSTASSYLIASGLFAGTEGFAEATQFALLGGLISTMGIGATGIFAYGTHWRQCAQVQVGTPEKDQQGGKILHSQSFSTKALWIAICYAVARLNQSLTQTQVPDFAIEILQQSTQMSSAYLLLGRGRETSHGKVESRTSSVSPSRESLGFSLAKSWGLASDWPRAGFLASDWPRAGRWASRWAESWAHGFSLAESWGRGFSLAESRGPGFSLANSQGPDFSLAAGLG